MRLSKGFTILEVLIVVSILGLVATFVYPSISKIVDSFQRKILSKAESVHKELDSFCEFLGGGKDCLR